MSLSARILVDEVVCAFLLDVVGMSQQPDDLVSGKRQRHEHKQGLGVWGWKEKRYKVKEEALLYNNISCLRDRSNN